MLAQDESGSFLNTLDRVEEALHAHDQALGLAQWLARGA